MASPYKTEVTLVVEAQTQWGDTVAVVGNIPELGTFLQTAPISLGYWDWAKARIMRTEAHTYPQWTVSFYAQLGEEIQYKYIILSPTPNPTKLKPVKWEQHCNRRLVTAGTRMTVEDGSFSGTEEPKSHISQVWSAGEFQVSKMFTSSSNSSRSE
jgi:hypothetical protein